MLSICDKCKFVFKNEHGLSIHKGKAHTDKLETPKNVPPSQPDITYHCEKCNFKTIYQKVLRGHTKWKHEISEIMSSKEAAPSPDLKTTGSVKYNTSQTGARRINEAKYVQDNIRISQKKYCAGSK